MTGAKEAATGTQMPGLKISSIKIAGNQDIALPGGGVTAIVGGNNTGKSTLLRQISEWLNNGEHVFKQGYQSGRHLMLEGLEVELSSTPQQVFEWIKSTSIYQKPTPRAPHITPGFIRMGTNPVSEHMVVENWRNLELGSFSVLAPFFVYYAGAAGRSGMQFTAGRRPRPGDPPAHPIQYLEDFDPIRIKVDELFFEIFGQHLTLDKLGNQTSLRVGDAPAGLESLKYYDDELPLREQLDNLPLVDEQGDGVKSLLGLLLPIITAVNPIVIVDEPEAFLHPPQAVKLGKILGELSRDVGVQVILATHDRNVIIGLLQSKAPLSVVRLTRDRDSTRAYALDPEKINSIWSDPVLRYSHVLDGLFHSLVVVTENERDCTFYAAALDSASENGKISIQPSEVLFVPTGGKDGMAPVVRALAEISVPIVASPDIDMLDDATKLERLVTALGGNWDELKDDYRICALELNRPREPVLVAKLVGDAKKFLEEAIKDDPARVWSVDLKDEFKRLTRGGQNIWDELKYYGVAALPKNIESRALNLLDNLESIGLVVVRVGVLESFARSFGVTERKGLGWIRSALESKVHEGEAASDHVVRLVRAKSVAVPAES